MDLPGIEPNAASPLNTLFERFLKPIWDRGRLDYDGELGGDMAVMLSKMDSLSIDVVDYMERLLADPARTLNDYQPGKPSPLVEFESVFAKLRELDNDMTFFKETLLKRAYDSSVLAGDGTALTVEGLGDIFDLDAARNVGMDQIVHTLDFVSQQFNRYLDIARSLLTSYDGLRK